MSMNPINWLVCYKGLLIPALTACRIDRFKLKERSSAFPVLSITVQKECIKQFILQNGGQVLSGVSKKCDYVVVGDEGSDAWTTKNYGSKVKKALELQFKGDDIQIVSEDALGL